MVESLTDSLIEAAQTNPVEEKLETVESGDSMSMVYHGVKIQTVEELLIDAGVDLRIWEIHRKTINNWEVAGKLKSKGAQSLWKTGLRQIKVDLRRKAPKIVQDGITELLKEVRPLASFKVPKRPKQDRNMMEIGIHDAHFAKLCYGVETGTNYDLEIAEAEFRSAIDEMFEKAKWFNVEKIVLPVGSDAMHYNSEEKTTANDTPMATSSDDRITKAFKVVCRSYQYAIEKGLKIAPLDVVYVAGNHDRTIAWFCTEWLAAKFDHSKSVNVLNSPTHRKYIAYGPSLLGYTHGDEVPADRLPGLMAQEVPELWAASKFRSWRTGHFHKKKETRFIVGDTHNGVEVYVFPSLCGTDSWHYRKGFVGNARMAEVHFWSETTGPSAMFHVHAREPRVALGN